MQNIRQFREHTGITVKQLAKAIGQKTSAVYHYESGRRTPYLTRCWSIVNALNELGATCSFEEVFPNPNRNTEINNKRAA
jgi:putative transcriptional regulator